MHRVHLGQQQLWLRFQALLATLSLASRLARYQRAHRIYAQTAPLTCLIYQTILTNDYAIAPIEYLDGYVVSQSHHGSRLPDNQKRNLVYVPWHVFFMLQHQAT